MNTVRARNMGDLSLQVRHKLDRHLFRTLLNHAGHHLLHFLGRELGERLDRDQLVGTAQKVSSLPGPRERVQVSVAR